MKTTLPDTREGSLFVGYIDAFMKLKAEYISYHDEEQYKVSFLKSGDLRLEREAIKPNAAKRGRAKLCLNSMWENLTKRIDRTRSKIITGPNELYVFLATPGIEVTNLAFASDEVVWHSWKVCAEENVPYLPHTNEVIGAYVSAVEEFICVVFSSATRERDLLRHRIRYIYSAER